MICPHCKKETPDNKLYCDHCKKYCFTEKIKRVVTKAKDLESKKEYPEALRYYKVARKIAPQNARLLEQIDNTVEIINKLIATKENTLQNISSETVKKSIENKEVRSNYNVNPVKNKNKHKKMLSIIVASILGLVMIYLFGFNNLQNKISLDDNYISKEEKMIRIFHEHGADIDIKNKKGVPPIVIPLALKNNARVVSEFIKYGANLNIKIENKSIKDICISELNIPEAFWYVMVGDINSLKNMDLLKIINKKDSKGNNILFYCSNKEIFSYLLSIGANPNVVNKQGFSCIHNAIEKEYIDVLELLSQSPKNLLLRDKKGNTPLHLAVAKNNINLVNILLNNGASVNVTNNIGQTPLHIACMPMHFSTKFPMSKFQDICGGFNYLKFVMQCILEIMKKGSYYYYKNVLPDNYDFPDKNIIKQLIKRGANLHEEDNNGCSALHYAIFTTSIDIVKMVFTKKSKLNYSDTLLLSPIIFSTFMDNVQITEFLYENSAEINFKDISLLHFAALFNSSKCASFLYKQNCKWEIGEYNAKYLFNRINKGSNDYHWYAFVGDEEKLLKGNAEEINKINQSNLMPIHYLTDKNIFAKLYAKYSSIYLNHGYSIYPWLELLSKNRNGAQTIEKISGFIRTSNSFLPYENIEYIFRNMNNIIDKEKVILKYIQTAIKLNDIKTISLFVDNGLGNIKRWPRNMSPLHMAVWYNRPEIVDYLLDKDLFYKLDAKLGKPIHYIGSMGWWYKTKTYF